MCEGPELGGSISGAGIVLSSVTKRFVAGATTRCIFDAFSVDFAPGMITAVIGPSGVGKSTLLRMISGLEAVDGGRVEIGPEAKPIRYAFQSDVLLPWRTVVGNIRLSGDLTGKPIAAPALTKALEQIRLADYAGAFPVQLSGGMRRRVALARVVVSDFKSILLDEPLTGVDLPTRISLLVWLRDVVRARQAICLAVMHDLDDAIQFADRIVSLVGSPARIGLDAQVPFERPETTKGVWALRRSESFIGFAESLADSLAGEGQS